MKIYLILILIILSLFACQQPTDTDIKKTDFVLELPDTTKTHQPDIFYEVKKKLVNELNLERLENGVDSFELRLWTKVEVINGGEVFVIKKINNNWTCLNYSFIESEKNWMNGRDIFENLLDFSVDTFWVNKKSPKSDWTTFLTAIEKEKIYELPNQSEIKGWENQVSDGYTYYVEFANKAKYRFYSYNCPDVYEKDFDECKRMTNILKIFDKEIGLNIDVWK